MSQNADHQYVNETPARRGEVLRITVDTTARAYALSDLDLGGHAVKESRSREYVWVTMQALGDAVWYQFSATDDADLDETAAVAAGGDPVPTSAMGECIAENATVRLRLNRQRDKFLVMKSASAASITFRASSESAVD